MGGLAVLAIIGVILVVIDLIKEESESTIPAGYRNNKELYEEDLWKLDGKTLEKNIRNGKYR